MVVGEPQILSQVKQAYQWAAEARTTGPLTNAAFQAALKTARRVAGETRIHQHRVSIASVAVCELAQEIFERFDNKEVLVIGAGGMAEEALKYLREEGARRVTIVNRSPQRASDLAARWKGRVRPWASLLEAIVDADLVISTTGAPQAIVGSEQFQRIAPQRAGRVLFILDLAVPRDFDPAIGERPGVYLYSLDDLQLACRRNQAQRDREMPAALRIVEEETDRFLAEWRQRAIGPVVRLLREDWEEAEAKELERLFRRLPQLDDRAREEIHRAFDRLVGKLLHPPLESLRHEARHGIPESLLGALARLFHLKERSSRS